MSTLRGMGVSRGVAIGTVFVKQEAEPKIERTAIRSAPAELKRLEEALKRAEQQLKELYERALEAVGESEALIFEVHRMMLADEDFLGRIREVISGEKVNAAYAVTVARDEYAALFSQMDDAYMKERAADIVDISTRLINALTGTTPGSLTGIKEPVIVAARDLLPSDTMQIDKQYLLGIITEAGGETSHSSILARAMQIPAVVGVPGLLASLQPGATVIIDGEGGEVFVNPSQSQTKHWRQKQSEHTEYLARLQRLKGTESITRDGVRIRVAANIATPEDLDSVLANDAEGIGLFRTEFLYMHGDALPSEEVQFQAYKSVLEKLKDRPVIIRTLDVGGDKEIPYLDIPREDNPFLGYRAIRVCLDRPELFKTQLRALLRASIYGQLGIMFPMITGVAEVRRAKELVREVQAELRENGVPYSPDFEIGVMIETPAAAMISAELAKEVDFFSIGTNDLTQYTLAVDRMNTKVAHLYDTHHPAVLRLMRLTIENGHKEGIWVGICGEAAADLSLTETFVAMGIDELSMNAGSVLEIRERIQGINAAAARKWLQI